MDTGAGYARQRRDISELLDGLAGGQELRPFPGCPAWRGRALLSHLARLPADIVEACVDGAGGRPGSTRIAFDISGPWAGRRPGA